MPRSPTPEVEATEVEKVLTLLYWQAPSLPSPYLSGGFKDRDAGAVTLEPLAKYDPEGNLVPALAAEIPTPENGGFAEDLMSITWKLKEGLRWSDGSDLTADDVVFTWRYCVDGETGCTSESSFDGIASVEAVDNLSVKVTFEAPTPYPYSAFVSTGVPIISRAQFGECIGAAAATCDAQNTALLAPGPIASSISRSTTRPYTSAIPSTEARRRTSTGSCSRAAGMLSRRRGPCWKMGKQTTAGTCRLSLRYLAEMEEQGRGKVVSAFASLVERIVVNQTNPDPELGEDRSEYLDGQNPHPFLSFRPIRQAMSMTIDRGRISEELYGFAGEPTCNLVTGPPRYVSTANDGCLSQDIEGAKKLLDDNGVVDTDGDGVREYEGVPLRIRYQTSTNSIRQDTQALVSDWWREIGIETELVDHDASVFFGVDPVDDKEASYRRFFADVQMYASETGIDPQESLSGLLCKHIPTREDNWSLGNIARACNPEYDSLFAKLEQTGIGQEREVLVKQLNDIHVQSYVEIPLVNRGYVSAHLNTLKGVRINGWDSELWNIAEWRR